MWVCIIHDGRSLSRIPVQQINKFLYSELDRIKIIYLSLEQISTDQELREPWEAFVSIPRNSLHWYSSDQLFPFNICAVGGQATRQFKQSMTVWEPSSNPPNYLWSLERVQRKMLRPTLSVQALPLERCQHCQGRKGRKQPFTSQLSLKHREPEITSHH